MRSPSFRGAFFAGYHINHLPGGFDVNHFTDDSPILIRKLSSIDDLFYEPIYQAVRHILMAHEIRKHHPEIDEVVCLHMRSESNRVLIVNPSPGLVQGDTVYDAIRAVMREPGGLVDAGYEGVSTLIATYIKWYLSGILALLLLLLRKFGNIRSLLRIDPELLLQISNITILPTFLFSMTIVIISVRSYSEWK